MPQPKCVMQITEYAPDRFKISVCANCQKENNEDDAVRIFGKEYVAKHRFAMVSHGICPTHYQQVMAERGLD